MAVWVLLQAVPSVGSEAKVREKDGRQRYRCLSCSHVFKRRQANLPVSLVDFLAFRRYTVKTVDQETLC